MSDRSAPLDVPTARERLDIRKALVAAKIGPSVLHALRAHGADSWIVLDRENHCDPLHRDVGAPYSGAAAASIFIDNGPAGLEAIFIGSPQPADSPLARAYHRTDYSAATLADVLRRTAEAVARRNPKRIGVNTSPSTGAADGLASGLHRQLIDALGPALASRVESAEAVAHAFRASRTPLEREWYTRLQQWTARLLEETLAGIHPGQTTALDLACRFEDAAVPHGLGLVRDHGRYPLIAWFGDRTSMAGVADSGPERPLRPGATDLRDFPLQPGDLVTLDGGLRFLDFHSDMKRTAYLLSAGETAPPDSLRQAWTALRDVAERYARRLVPGASAGQVFADLWAELAAHGYEPARGTPASSAAGRARVAIYGHSIGNAVHDIGPRVTDGQTPGPPLHLQSGEWTSIEFHLEVPAPDAPRGAWIVRFEQTASVSPAGAAWLMPPQQDLLLVPSPPGVLPPRHAESSARHQPGRTRCSPRTR